MADNIIPFDAGIFGAGMGAKLKALIDEKLASLPKPNEPKDPVVNVAAPVVTVNVDPTPVTVSPNIALTLPQQPVNIDAPVTVTVDMAELANLFAQFMARPAIEFPDNGKLAGEMVTRIETAISGLEVSMEMNVKAIVAALTAEKMIVNGADGKPQSLKVK